MQQQAWAEGSDAPVEGKKAVRVVDVGAPARKGGDGTKYPVNEVHTAKYALYSFVFVNLFEQFQRLANFYFLVQSVLVCAPPLTLTLVCAGVCPASDPNPDTRDHPFMVPLLNSQNQMQQYKSNPDPDTNHNLHCNLYHNLHRKSDPRPYPEKREIEHSRANSSNPNPIVTVTVIVTVSVTVTVAV